MAQLIPPSVGYRLRLVSGKPSKVHLARPRGDQTICKFIIWDDTERVDLATVKAGEVCQRCLGAMEARD